MSFGSSLMIGFVFMDFALSAYLRVDSVSSKLSRDGERAAIITVFVLPPSESYSNLVSLLSLNGICLEFPTTKALITLPRAVRDKLIFLASSSLSPVA